MVTLALDPKIAGDLDAIANLLERYDAHSAARFCSRLRARYDSVAALVTEMDTNEYWGGAGSLADQGLCVSPLPDDPAFLRARREFWDHIAKVGEYLLSQGASNPRVRMWVDVFRKWCADGI
jgi:hypothetical protein